MKWGVWQHVGLACFVSVQKHALPPEKFRKFALLRLNLKVVLTENYKNVVAILPHW